AQRPDGVLGRVAPERKADDASAHPSRIATKIDQASLAATSAGEGRAAGSLAIMSAISCDNATPGRSGTGSLMCPMRTFPQLSLPNGGRPESIQKRRQPRP